MSETKSKDIQDILQEIKERRNQELVDKKDNRVFFTVVEPLAKKDNNDKQIYRIMEEYSIGENQSQVRELFYEYKENPELIAMIDPEVNDKLNKIDPEAISKLNSGLSDEIVPVGDPNESKEKQETWMKTLENINYGREKNKEKLIEQAKKLGIEEKEIKGIAEIDLKKKVFEKIDELNENEKSKEEEKEEKNQNEPTEISKEEGERYGIIGMNSIPLNQRVGVHGETLKSELGLNSKEYSDVVELELIPSYKMSQIDGKVYDVPFMPVGKKSNGEIIKFPESVASPYKGSNNEVTTLDGKYDSVKKENSNCIINFKNGNKKTSLVIDQKSPYGIVDASIAYNTRDNDGRVALDLKNKYDGISQQDTQTQEILDSHNGTYNANKIINEVREHPSEEIKNGELSIDEADGNEETGHVHPSKETEMTPDTILKYDGKEMTVEEIASLPRFRLSSEEFIEKYKENISSEKEQNYDEEQVFDEIEEEVNEEYRGEKDK